MDIGEMCVHKTFKSIHHSLFLGSMQVQQKLSTAQEEKVIIPTLHVLLVTYLNFPHSRRVQTLSNDFMQEDDATQLMQDVPKPPVVQVEE